MSDPSDNHDNIPKGKANHANKRQAQGQGPRKSVAPSPPVRETSFVIKQKQDKQRRERMFEVWQNLKDELRDQETDRLREKIQLQHELIRASDEQYAERQERRQQQYFKKRDQEKKEREAKTDALLQVCRESLEDDRRVAAQKRAVEQRQKIRDKVQYTNFPSALLIEAKNDDPTEDNDEEFTRTITQTSLESAPLYLPVSTADTTATGGENLDVFETLKEEEGEGFVEEDDIEYEELPWHHAQLYQLYGKDADYFLHPKIDVVQKAAVTLNPRLRTIGGRAGAGTLWNVLRTESRARLLRQDTKLLGPELRSAFGAFAREGLTKKRQPVQRNFNASDDVPDLTRLMDQSRVHNAQDFRHKVELMFRSSNINKDRTKVLMYNNPPPDLNNMEGDEGVQRYMPSWADEDWDKESEPSYRKWLHQNKDQSVDTARSSLDPDITARTPSPTPRKRSPTPNKPSSSIDLKHILSDHSKHRSAKPNPNQPKYFFLTEEGATCQGEFSKQRKELLEAKHRPQAYDGGDGATVLPHKARSAMAVLEDERGDNTDRSERSLNASDKPTVSDRAQSEMSHQYYTKWQPLSLGALVEYKDNYDIPGHGRFNQGKKIVWDTRQASAIA